MNVTIEGEPWVLGGDILVAVNGLQVKAPEDFVKVYQALRVGQTVQLSLMRNGSPQTITVTLEEQPRPSAAYGIPSVPEPAEYRPAGLSSSATEVRTVDTIIF